MHGYLRITKPGFGNGFLNKEKNNLIIDMERNDKLVKVFTGSEVIINRIKVVLEQNGILTIIKDGFKEGISAGFGGGVPSAIDIFVVESEFDKAQGIINDLTE